MSLFKKCDMASLYSMCIHKVFIFPPKLYKFLSWLKIILKAFCCVLRFNQIFSPISDCNMIFCVHFFPNYIAINNQAFVLRLRVGWGGLSEMVSPVCYRAVWCKMVGQKPRGVDIRGQVSDWHHTPEDMERTLPARHREAPRVSKNWANSNSDWWPLSGEVHLREYSSHQCTHVWECGQNEGK